MAPPRARGWVRPGARRRYLWADIGRPQLALVGALLLGMLALALLLWLSRSLSPDDASLAAPGVRPTLSATGPAVAGARATAAPPAGVATSLALRSPVAAAPATASPASRAAALPAPQLTPTPLADGRVLLDTLFSGPPQPSWVDNSPFAGWSDGAYRLQVRQATHFVAVGGPIQDVPDDVVVSATLRKTGGPPGGGYGVIVRDRGPEPRDGANQEMNAYVLEAGDLGEFGIWRRDGDHWVDLVPWRRGPSVRVGGSPNELSARVSGASLTFTINGVQVASVDDDALPTGGVGVFAGGDFNEVAVDRFTVQVPE